MASSAVQAALDEAGKVVKKQKTISARTDACLDTLIGLVAGARDALSEDSMQDAEEVLQGLLKRIEAQGIAKELNAQTKELHSSIGKLGKVRGGSGSAYREPTQRPAPSVARPHRRLWTSSRTGSRSCARRCPTSASTSRR
jgi:hypothetical protein